jgi:hypothetical protein
MTANGQALWLTVTTAETLPHLVARQRNPSPLGPRRDRRLGNGLSRALGDPLRNEP